MDPGTISLIWAGVLGAVGANLGYLIARFINRRYPRFPWANPTVFLILGSILFYVSFRSFVMPAPAPQSLEESMARLWEHEGGVFELLARDHPEIRGIVETRARRAYQRGGLTAVTNEMGVMGQELFSQYITAYIPTADDDAVDRFGERILEQALYILENQPDLCFYWLFGGRDDLGSRLRFPSSMSSKSGKAIADVIRTGILGRGKPRDSYSPGEFQQVTASLADEIAVKLSPRDLFVEGVDNPALAVTADDRRRACRTAVAINEVIRERGFDERVKIYRMLYAAAAGQY